MRVAPLVHVASPACASRPALRRLACHVAAPLPQGPGTGPNKPLRIRGRLPAADAVWRASMGRAARSPDPVRNNHRAAEAARAGGLPTSAAGELPVGGFW